MEIDLDDLEITAFQAWCMEAGHFLNIPSRAFIHQIDQWTRSTQKTTLDKVAIFAKAVFSLLFSIPFAPIGLLCYWMASLAGRGRFERISFEGGGPRPDNQTTLKIVSLNACLQDPWSIFTGGVVPPFEKIDGKSRIDHLAEQLGNTSADLIFLQEVEDLAAQKALIEGLKEKGYFHFVRDTGASLWGLNPSGLFIASKHPLEHLRFTPYPWKDREGLAKGSGQGALSLNVSLNNRSICLLNTHLNYGDERYQAVREKQLSHLDKLLENPSVLFGDLNFSCRTWGSHQNAIYDQVTCSDQGKHNLRGKSLDGCEDCEEKIDGVLHKLDNFEVTSTVEKTSFSDHYLVTTNIK